MKILDGKHLSNLILDELKNETKEFILKENIVPTIAVILVSDDPASATYVRTKKKRAKEMGFNNIDYKLDSSVTEEELISLIEELNNNDEVHAILVQLPLPKHIDKDKIINTIDYKKDVDGFTLLNVGRLALAKDCFIPCTPKGIVALLEYYKIETEGKRVCVIGRSNIVGQPIATILMQSPYNATVTVCNSKTKDLKSITKTSDIIIVAAGVKNILTQDMITEDAVIIDVGINRIIEDGKSRLVGDVAHIDSCAAITPVPGGVGPMTIACLMQNTLKAAKGLK